MRLFFLLLSSLALALGACAESPREALSGSQKALSEARYPEAIAAADAGLAAGADEVTAWGLQLVRLEALARGGQGDAAVALLTQLAAERPQQVSASQYRATADQLRSAQQGAAAIQALDLGLKRFPQDVALMEQIEEAKKAPAAGGGELEMLRSLGYVE